MIRFRFLPRLNPRFIPCPATMSMSTSRYTPTPLVVILGSTGTGKSEVSLPGEVSCRY